MRRKNSLKNRPLLINSHRGTTKSDEVTEKDYDSPGRNYSDILCFYKFDLFSKFQNGHNAQQEYFSYWVKVLVKKLSPVICTYNYEKPKSQNVPDLLFSLSLFNCSEKMKFLKNKFTSMRSSYYTFSSINSDHNNTVNFGPHNGTMFFIFFVGNAH